MKRVSLFLVIVLTVTATFAFAQNFRSLRANLRGFEEPPPISTTGNGKFTAQINNNQTIDWALSYSDLEGSVQQAHIHFGQRRVNGGITVFLCTNLGNGPAGTQACPPPPATITGTITAADVLTAIHPPSGVNSGLGAGEFDELVRAIHAGATYANVHSTLWPGGEIRGQIGPGQGHDGH